LKTGFPPTWQPRLLKIGKTSDNQTYLAQVAHQFSPSPRAYRIDALGFRRWRSIAS
jgi:hypothetical protein